MGFLKRLFSRKGKKPQRKPVISNPLPIIRETGNDSMAEVTAILRSSSARYAVVREFDHTALPPIPHPINQVLPTPPASSAVSLASATSSINSTRGTFTVKVHQRRRHTSTEFPNAYGDEGPSHQGNSSQLLGLRSDPSVASLLDLYDEHGRLPKQAFSNSPPREGRAQVVRSGSDTSDLGDISWAEQFLGETESITSTVSSPTIATPDTDAHFPVDDISSSILENAGISSLEVEVSDIVETPPRTTHNQGPYASSDPSTPQRASQVFGFLTKDRGSKVIEDDERSLPELPDVFGSPSSDEEPQLPRNRSRSHFSPDSSLDASRPSTPEAPTPANNVQIILPHGPTKVIVTAPTPSQHHDSLVQIPIRGPRGPRAHQRYRSLKMSQARDSYTALPVRRHVSRGSLASISVSSVEQRPRADAPPKEEQLIKKGSKRRSILAVFEKENSLLSAKREVPRTPIRTGSISRPLPHRGSIKAASPARSLELSETGKRIQAEERARARYI
ncbi:hypothetical protein HMN09_00702400 [Mycena chlorophos]|uniref:Uncharacterized protein n=1 Tax=Mycena chlorophos TaxID=658473 RepID=A0A8H6SYW0_MYCCL|nr:hypothetical protein HMN09_00702400 [Mycena chlorophos]